MSARCLLPLYMTEWAYILKKPDNIIHILLCLLLSTVKHISDNTSVLKVLPVHASVILVWFG